MLQVFAHDPNILTPIAGRCFYCIYVSVDVSVFGCAFVFGNGSDQHIVNLNMVVGFYVGIHFLLRRHASGASIAWR